MAQQERSTERGDYRVTFEKSSDDPIGQALVRGKHGVQTDEPHGPPVGTGNDEAPSPVDLLVTSLISCQASVLAQTLVKARIEEFQIDVGASIDGRHDIEAVEDLPEKWFIENITVDLDLEVPEEFEPRAQRCLDVYDQGCIVGRSFREGLDYTTNTTLSST